MRLKKCKAPGCEIKFIPDRPLQQVCCTKCAFALSRHKGLQIQKKERKEGLERLKTRSEHAKAAQAVINKYVRLRDKHLGCISCDKPSSWNGQWHASHFRSVGEASAIRFNLWNINKSCSVCNNWKSGNLSEYEPRLREKIGNKKVDWLRTQNQRTNYSIEYLQRIVKIFKKKIKTLTE